MVRTIDSLIEAEPEQVGLSSARLASLTRLVHGQVDEGQLPGSITLIGRHGKVAYFDVYGSMDLEAKKPMQADTIVRIYSMTKPIVSVALMMLYEEGYFQLDDPASKHIPEFKNLKVFASGTAEVPLMREPAREMTVRDLLMHTSGLLGFANATTPVGQLYRDAKLPSITAENQTLRDLIKKLGTLPLQFDPGTQWLYSIATDVVGYLVEVFSGQPLDQFLQERILGPLGMDDTGFHVPESKHERFAANYRSGREGESTLMLQDAAAGSRFAVPQTYFSGVGGMVSTAHDYMRFCKMLANGGLLDGVRILGPRTIQLMAMNHLPGGKDMAAMSNAGYSEVARYGQGFGLGFSVLLNPVEAATLGTPGEYGWGGAAGTVFFVNPAEDLFVVFLTQLMAAQFVRRPLRVMTYASIID
ncbi:MAG TPA: serine hydrolase domain-containing protein [Dehalococcoidia bacterium]|nr:serine hydrolase domain-containing protein [Dehalococcoidia bacterium]